MATSSSTLTLYGFDFLRMLQLEELERSCSIFFQHGVGLTSHICKRDLKPFLKKNPNCTVIVQFPSHHYTIYVEEIRL